MQVVEKHGKEFRETDVITAFTAMAKWKDSAGNSDVLHSKSFQTLVGTILSDSRASHANGRTHPDNAHQAGPAACMKLSCAVRRYGHHGAEEVQQLRADQRHQSCWDLAV